MKKSLLVLAALATSAATLFAEDVPRKATFSSPNGKVVVDPETETSYLELNTVDATVNVEFDTPLPSEEEATLMVVCTPGVADFTVDMIPVEPIPNGSPNGFAVVLDKELWGNPYMGEYHTSIMITWMTLDGDFFYNEEDEPIFIQMPCVTPNTFPAELVYAYPNGTWEDGDNFTDVYNRGEIMFAFSNPVTFANPDNVATIEYFAEGEFIDSYTISKETCEIGWNRMDGYYTVSFSFPNNEYAADELSGVSITLNGIQYVYESGAIVPVSVPTVMLNNSIITPMQRKVKSRMAEGLGTSNALVNVYNVQGMLVKENIAPADINNLPSGFYIVDGKKIVVR